ncbi:MAG: hypothetical protein U9N55_05815, partial [candidate division Zixibacteria bacterium]|nr:hypothetical protein [candidate division Zixibacteria bacterium]
MWIKLQYQTFPDAILGLVEKLVIMYHNLPAFGGRARLSSGQVAGGLVLTCLSAHRKCAVACRPFLYTHLSATGRA